MTHEVAPGSIPVGDTGKNLDTTVVTTTEGDVHREAVFIADPAEPDARANVVGNIKDDHTYALLVKDENSRHIVNTLGAIVEQNERIIMMLESIAE